MVANHTLLAKQLMPFELRVGYSTDMNRPEAGRRRIADPAPATMDTPKQMSMAKLNTVRTVAQFKRASTQDPTNLPAARSTKKIEMAYVATQISRPWYSASSVGIHTYTALSTMTYRNIAA